MKTKTRIKKMKVSAPITPVTPAPAFPAPASAYKLVEMRGISPEFCPVFKIGTENAIRFTPEFRRVVSAGQPLNIVEAERDALQAQAIHDGRSLIELRYGIHI